MRAIRFAGRFGSELDPALDAALRKDSSLEGISAERIKDEFVKGIISAKSVKHFLGLIAKYNLFKWVFKGLNVTDNFVEDKDPIVVIASLLTDNDSRVLPKIMVLNLKYKDDEMRPIKFLIDLLQLSVDNAVLLKRAESVAKVTPEQIKKFASFNRVDTKLLQAFLTFKLSVSGGAVKAEFNLPDGPELGKMILKLETENFKKLL